MWSISIFRKTSTFQEPRGGVMAASIDPFELPNKHHHWHADGFPNHFNRINKSTGRPDFQTL